MRFVYDVKQKKVNTLVIINKSQIKFNREGISQNINIDKKVKLIKNITIGFDVLMKVNKWN